MSSIQGHVEGGRTGLAAAILRGRSCAIMLAMAAGAILNGCTAVHQQNAQSAFATGNNEAAATEIQSALASDPGNLELKHLAAQIFTQRGVKYYQQNAMIAARADFQRAVDYEPTYAQAWDYLGLIAFAQHDWQTAIADGQKAAGYSGQADPLYVKQAQDELRKVQSGGIKPYVGSRRRSVRARRRSMKRRNCTQSLWQNRNIARPDR